MITCTSTAKPGYQIWWDTPLDSILGQPEHRTILTRSYAGVATLLLEGNTVLVVGSDILPIR
jgi:hypothetical protein